MHAHTLRQPTQGDADPPPKVSFAPFDFGWEICFHLTQAGSELCTEELDLGVEQK